MALGVVVWFDYSNVCSIVLLLLAMLHRLCAGWSGDMGCPGMMWSASILSPGWNGCWHMAQWVAVAMICFRCFL